MEHGERAGLHPVVRDEPAGHSSEGDDQLIQLVEGRCRPTPSCGRSNRTDGIGPNTRLVIPAAADGTLLSPTDLVARARTLGLLVHVWTLRSEPIFLSPSYSGDIGVEFRQFRDLGVDGLFTDFPDAAARALNATLPFSR